MIIWRLLDPEPGNWLVDVSGVNGSLSGWNTSINKFNIVFESFGAVPVNESSTIGAFVTDGSRNVTLEGVTLVAEITNPEGTTFVHELNDNGVSGDAMAGDGFFSATLPPLSTTGDYKDYVELIN